MPKLKLFFAACFLLPLLSSCGESGSSWGGDYAVSVRSIETESSVELYLEGKAEHQLSPKVIPSNAPDNLLLYSSNNKNIADVDNTGLISGKSVGSAEITVSSLSNPAVTSKVRVTVRQKQEGGSIGDIGMDVKWDLSTPVTFPNVPLDLSKFDTSGVGKPVDDKPENATNLIGRYRIQYITVFAPDGSAFINNIANSNETMDGEVEVNAVSCVEAKNDNPAFDISKCDASLPLAIQFQYKSQFHPDLDDLPSDLIKTTIYWTLFQGGMDDKDPIGAEFKKLGADIVPDPNKSGEYAVKFTLTSADMRMLPAGAKMQITLKKIADRELGAPEPLNSLPYFSSSSAVSGITVSPKDILLEIGKKDQIKHEIMPANAKNKDVKYTSSNDKIAAVDKDGNITGIGEGECDITVTSVDGGFKDTVHVTVIKEKVAVTAISANPEKVNIDMKSGNTADVNLTVLPADASDKRLSAEYTSAAFSASIQGNLLKITALKIGSGVINVRSKSEASVYKAIQVNITDSTIHPESVSFGASSEIVEVGKSKALNYQIYPANADDKRVAFTSSDVTVLKVDTNGVITGVKAGSATVTVETLDGRKTASISVTVQKPHVALKGISIQSALSISDGGSSALPQVTFTPADATNKKVSWSVSDTNVIKIEGDKVVVVGSSNTDRTAKLIVTSEEGPFTAECVVTVTTNFVKTTGVSITNSIAGDELKKGGTFKLNHTVSPANATNKAVTWKSSDNSVITVGSDGSLTAVGTGSATITVSSDSDNAIKDEYNIYVWEPADKISGSYSVESLDITYNGKEYKSSGADKNKPYHYDMAAFAVKIDGKSMDISGKFQLVWSHFVTNPELDVFRYRFFTHRDSVSDARDMGTDRIGAKKITINSDGSLVYEFPFSVGNDNTLTYDAYSGNKLVIKLKNKNAYSAVSSGKWRDVTPVHFDDPYSIGGTYDMLTFVQTNGAGLNVGAEYYYEVNEGSLWSPNKVKYNSLDRMIGEVSVTADTINKTMDMKSKIQMNSKQLNRTYLGQNLVTEQFQVTTYNKVNYDLDSVIANKTFGNGNAQTDGKVTPDTSLWEGQTSDIKIYSGFSKIGVNVTVSVYAKKKSDTPISLDTNTAYYCTSANYKGNAACPNPEPPAEKGIVTQKW